MEDPNQIVVPPSFLALFATPGGYRLTEPMAVVRERYELCEDLSQLLAERLAAASFADDRRDVLQTIRGALAGAGVELPEPQALWIATRVAELLGWDAPSVGTPDG